MNNDYIILDTNFLRETSKEKLAEMIIDNNLITIEEVYEECPKNTRAKIKETGVIVKKIDKKSYDVLNLIMKKKEVSILINYLNNEGVADPLIVAYAIKLKNELKAGAQTSLFGDGIVFVATKDSGVCAACKLFDIDIFNPEP